MFGRFSVEICSWW